MQLEMLRFQAQRLATPVFIWDDTKLLHEAFYALTNRRLFLLMTRKYMSGKKPPSSRFKGTWAEFMCQLPNKGVDGTAGRW